MDSIETKFAKLATNNAPGQEVRQKDGDMQSLLKGDKLAGTPVDFSHGDVDAFLPAPGALEAFNAGVALGGQRAYTEYRGSAYIRKLVAERLADFTGTTISSDEELIITTGTQGALFLAIASVVCANDKVAIVEPDYFANRKLVQFFDGKIVPIRLDYLGNDADAGLDLKGLEEAFKSGVKVFIFSNPNNPTGVIYSQDEVLRIANLANKYNANVIVDQLYSRLVYTGKPYTHLRAAGPEVNNLITILGPSKTESLSGYRLGVAFGAAHIIERMEKLQAIVSLRAAGYCQSVLEAWMSEPDGWIEQRVSLHQSIRDDLLDILRATPGLQVRSPEAGSYLFPTLPGLTVSVQDFVRILRHQADVTVTPGTEFGPHYNSIRLNFSQDHEAAVHAVERLVSLVERYR